jgi:hypothetical protein
MIDFLSRMVLIRVGATALLDSRALLLQRFFKVPAPNSGLVGRWFFHLTDARVSHDDIALARAYPFEHAVGWIGHYAIAIVHSASSWCSRARIGRRRRLWLPHSPRASLPWEPDGFCSSPAWERALSPQNFPTPYRSGCSTLPAISSSLSGCTGARYLSDRILAGRRHRTSGNCEVENM